MNILQIDTEKLNVTRKDLADRLAPCLCATSEFADYCIPLIIDKLCSTLKIAKLDSLHLLRESVQIFEPSRIKQYLPNLWTILQKDFLLDKNVEIKNATLETITSLIKSLSNDEIICKDFLNRIITDVKSSLHDTQLSLYKPAKILLETIATINKAICVHILQVIIPLCIEQYSTKISLNDKIILIETLNSFMKISSNYEFCIQGKLCHGKNDEYNKLSILYFLLYTTIIYYKLYILIFFINSYYINKLKFNPDVPELAWANIPQIYLNDLTVENVELKSKVFTGLTLQKAYLHDLQRSILYNEIWNEIETGCDEIQDVCHITIIDFAALYLQEISLLIEERLLSNIGELHMKN